MCATRFDQLELLAQVPPGQTRSTPLLFVHGAFAGAWCWEETFLPFFAQAGYACYALSLSGHAGSVGREYLNVLSIRDYVDDVSAVVAQLPRPPVLIGHSMGGFIVQRYLETQKMPGAALLCSAPPQGLFTAALGVVLHRPMLMRDLNVLMAGGKAAPRTIQEALFARPVSQERMQRFARLSQPESLRAIWDMTLLNVPRTLRITQTPLLILGAQEDRLIPPALVEATARTFQTSCEIFPEMGHGFMQEENWHKPAHRLLRWLEEIAP
jgi:pimeloyl-ACP methyl ester carboxylesterase